MRGRNLIRIKVQIDFTCKFSRARASHVQSLARKKQMVRGKATTAGQGPTIRGSDPWLASAGKNRQLLSEEERARLASIASIVRFKKGTEIYRQGSSATAVFNIINGVVKAYRTAPDGSEQIMEFLYPDDLFGLPEDGTYTNSTKALTAVTAFQIPVPALRSSLSRDAALEFHVICKLCQELRQAQQHSFILARRRALSKVAMFLQFLEQHQAAKGECTADIYLPMNRSDIGEYVGMSLEAVSRAFRSLTTRGIIDCRDRRHLKITDHTALEAISA